MTLKRETQAKEYNKATRTPKGASNKKNLATDSHYRQQLVGLRHQLTLTASPLLYTTAPLYN